MRPEANVTQEQRRASSIMHGMAIDRADVSRALAKAIAYKQCGKQAEAEAWAATLVRLLECANILRNGN